MHVKFLFHEHANNKSENFWKYTNIVHNLHLQHALIKSGKGKQLNTIEDFQTEEAQPRERQESQYI